MAKISLKSYFEPTPSLFKKIGDSIFLLGTTLSASFAGMDLNKWYVIGTIILTWLGKTITNFFTEGPKTPEDNAS